MAPPRSVGYWLTAARIELRVRRLKWRSRPKRKEVEGNTLEHRLSSWLIGQLPTDEEVEDDPTERPPLALLDTVVAAALWADSFRQIGTQMLIDGVTTAAQYMSGAGPLSASLSRDRASNAVTQAAVRVAVWHAHVSLALMRIAAAKIVQLSLLRSARGAGDDEGPGAGSNNYQNWNTWAERRVLLAANRVLTQGKKDNEPVATGVPELKRLLMTPPRELVAAGVVAAVFRPHVVLRFYMWFFPWTVWQASWQVTSFLISLNAVPLMLAGSVAVGAGSSLRQNLRRKAGAGGLAVAGFATRLRSML